MRSTLSLNTSAYDSSHLASALGARTFQIALSVAGPSLGGCRWFEVATQAIQTLESISQAVQVGYLSFIVTAHSRELLKLLLCLKDTIPIPEVHQLLTNSPTLFNALLRLLASQDSDIQTLSAMLLRSLSPNVATSELGGIAASSPGGIYLCQLISMILCSPIPRLIAPLFMLRCLQHHDLYPRQSVIAMNLRSPSSSQIEILEWLVAGAASEITPSITTWYMGIPQRTELIESGNGVNIHIPLNTTHGFTSLMTLLCDKTIWLTDPRVVALAAKVLLTLLSNPRLDTDAVRFGIWMQHGGANTRFFDALYQLDSLVLSHTLPSNHPLLSSNNLKRGEVLLHYAMLMKLLVHSLVIPCASLARLTAVDSHAELLWKPTGDAIELVDEKRGTGQQNNTSVQILHVMPRMLAWGLHLIQGFLPSHQDTASCLLSALEQFGISPGSMDLFSSGGLNHLRFGNDKRTGACCFSPSCALTQTIGWPHLPSSLTSQEFYLAHENTIAHSYLNGEHHLSDPNLVTYALTTGLCQLHSEHLSELFTIGFLQAWVELIAAVSLYARQKLLPGTDPMTVLRSIRFALSTVPAPFGIQTLQSESALCYQLSDVMLHAATRSVSEVVSPLVLVLTASYQSNVTGTTCSLTNEALNALLADLVRVHISESSVLVRSKHVRSILTLLRFMLSLSLQHPSVFNIDHRPLSHPTFISQLIRVSMGSQSNETANGCRIKLSECAQTVALLFILAHQLPSALRAPQDDAISPSRDGERLSQLITAMDFAMRSGFQHLLSAAHNEDTRMARRAAALLRQSSGVIEQLLQISRNPSSFNMKIATPISQLAQLTLTNLSQHPAWSVATEVILAASSDTFGKSVSIVNSLLLRAVSVFVSVALRLMSTTLDSTCLSNSTLNSHTESATSLPSEVARLIGDCLQKQSPLLTGLLNVSTMSALHSIQLQPNQAFQHSSLEMNRVEGLNLMTDVLAAPLDALLALLFHLSNAGIHGISISQKLCEPGGGLEFPNRLGMFARILREDKRLLAPSPSVPNSTQSTIQLISHHELSNAQQGFFTASILSESIRVTFSSALRYGVLTLLQLKRYSISGETTLRSFNSISNVSNPFIQIDSSLSIVLTELTHLVKNVNSEKDIVRLWMDTLQALVAYFSLSVSLDDSPNIGVTSQLNADIREACRLLSVGFDQQLSVNYSGNDNALLETEKPLRSTQLVKQQPNQMLGPSPFIAPGTDSHALQIFASNLQKHLT